MKLTLLPIATLRQLSLEDQDAMARDAAGMQETSKTATKTYTSSFPAAGKLVCVVQERLLAGKTAGAISSVTSVEEFWQSLTDTKLNPHALSCARAFSVYVLSGLIAEADYDANPSANLELAASIGSACKGVTSHAAVQKAADELAHKTKNSINVLRALLGTVKPSKPMDAEKATETLKAVFADGHFLLAIAAMGAEIASVKDLATAKQAFFGMIVANDMFGKNPNLTEDLLNQWANEQGGILTVITPAPALAAAA